MTMYRLAIREEGVGAPLLFLHALGASSRYWRGRLGDLSQRYRCLMPDLLGFAASPKPPRLAYTVDDHLAALVGTLEERGDLDRPLTIIGHSLGAILAVEFAARYPERVRGLIVMGLTLFASESEARAFINAHGGWAARSTMRTGRRAHIEYMLGMPLHPLIHYFAPRVVKSFPREIVEDSFKSTWVSYGRTLQRCILDHDLSPALAALTDRPIFALHGTNDPSAPLEKVQALAARMPNLHLETLPGGHHLFLEQHAACLAAIARYLSAERLWPARDTSFNCY